MTLKHTRIEVSNAVFSLPYHVAKEEGYFAGRRLRRRARARRFGPRPGPGGPRRPIEDHRAVKSYGWHEGIEKGEFCMYRACEWGQIRRTQDSGRNVRVISKRAAIATQAIVVRADSPYNVPAGPARQDRRGEFPRRLALHHALHAGRLDERQGRGARRARRRPQAAAALPGGRQGRGRRGDGAVDHGRREEGAQDLCEAFYEGAEVATPDVDPEMYAAITRAIARRSSKSTRTSGRISST